VTNEPTVCEACGGDANIHISNVVAGVVTMRHFCPDCVDDAQADRPRSQRHRGAAGMIGAVGLIALLLSVFADRLKLGSSVGFGWWQNLGVVVGAALLILGAATRAPALLIIGLIACVLAVLADWFALGSAEGFGILQIAGTSLGLVLVATAIWISRARAYPDS